MSNVTAIQTQQQVASLATLDDATMQRLVSGGDCASLSPAQKNAYYLARCEAAGLDPRAQPFAFMRLNGKEVLYAQKAATDQLAAKHGVRMTIVSQATEDGIRIVTVRAEAKDGRVTEEIGALPVKSLQGEALSNALMKCVTKAKRRAVLSLCGLGMLDETEVESIPQAQTEPPHVAAVVAAAVEVKPDPAPPPPTKKAGPPDYVLKLWARVVERQGGNKTLAQADLKHAGEAVFGDPPKPSSDWTVDDCKKVEAAIFADDVPF